MKNHPLFIILCILVHLLLSCPPDNECEEVLFEPIDDWPAESVLEKTNAQTSRITVTVILTNRGLDLSKIVVILPIPQTNPYQEITDIVPGDAVERVIEGTSDKYARFVFTSDLPGSNQNLQLNLTYTVTLYDLTAGLSGITTVYPYNQASDIYQYYRGASGTIVDPSNPDITGWSNTLMNQSTGIISYARHCYDFIAANFTYQNPNTGFHPLADIIAADGGDCGNLSSIFVSLLRCQNIPARHIAAMRPDGSAHVWADFYMQGYGWIPVDVTPAVMGYEGDYFGWQPRYNNGIIMHKEVSLPLYVEGGTVTVGGLQTFAYWYWGTGPGTLEYSYSLTGS